MKILIHSNAPFVPSGYGSQVRLLLPKLAEMGHEAVVSAFYGVSGSPINWKDWLILPAGQNNYGVDTIIPHAETYGADLILTLMDFWQLARVAPALNGRRLAAWLPTDCTPLGRPDRQVLAAAGAVPIAMSSFGLESCRNAGFDKAMYAPHAVDTSVFIPPADRRELRESLNLPTDAFIIGINAANRDGLRKGFPEQFNAFARFNRKHPDSKLMVHSVAQSVSGLDLTQLAEDMGISDDIIISEPYAQITGIMEPLVIADWYGCLDVLSSCSYGEGFGIPIIEAQACGTPVVATDCSAMTELAGPHGWLVGGQSFWNPTHRAWWIRPDVDRIVRSYEKAYAEWGTAKALKRSERCREFALSYDVDTVAAEYWAPLLKTLEEM